MRTHLTNALTRCRRHFLGDRLPASGAVAFAALAAALFAPSPAHAQVIGLRTPPTISGPLNTLIGRPGQRASGTLTVRDDRPGMTVTAGVGTVVPASIANATSADITYSFDIPANAFNGQTFNDVVTVTDATQLTAEAAVAIGVDAAPPQTSGPLNLVGAPGATVSGTLNVSDNQAGMSVSAAAGTVTPQAVGGTSAQIAYSLTIPQGASADQTLTDSIVVTDSVGNTTTVSVNVAVDDQPPEVSVAALNLTGAPGLPASATLSVSDDRAGISAAAGTGIVQPSAIAGVAGEVTYTFAVPADANASQTFSDTITFTDSVGNSMTVPVTIVIDDDVPQINGPSTLAGMPGETVSAAFMISDDRPNISVTAQPGMVQPATVAGTQEEVIFSFAIPQNAANGQQFAIVLLATDAAGNAVSANVTVTADDEMPQAGGPIGLAGEAGETVTQIITVSDNAPGLTIAAVNGQVNPASIAESQGDVIYSFSIPPGTAAGTTFQDTITVTDAARNPTTVAVTVTVEDRRKPNVISTLQLSGRPGEAPSQTITVSDNEPGMRIAANSGSVDPRAIEGRAGEFTYTFRIPADAATQRMFSDTITVIDTAGNTSTVDVTVTVLDIQPPEVLNAPLNLSGPPGAKVSGTLRVDDNRPGLTITTESGSVEPPAIAGKQGDVVYTFTIPADASSGLVINNTITVTDAAGNTTLATAIVTVADIGAPAILVGDILVGNLVLSAPPGQSAMSTFTVMDDLPGITVAAEMGSVSPRSIEGTSGQVVYTFLVPANATPISKPFNDVITVTDAAGNQTQIDVTISAADINAPQTPDELNVRGEASNMAMSTFTVRDDQPGIAITAENGTVDPGFIEAESGEVTYSFPIPEDVIKGQVFSDTLTITDAVGNIRTLPVKITVAGDGFADTLGLDDKQRGIAEALDAACAALVNAGTLTPDQQKLQATCDNLRSGTAGPLGAALDQIAPDELSSQGTMAVEAADGQARLIGSRLSALRGGATGVSVSGLSVNLFGQHLPQVVLESALPRAGAGEYDSSGYVSPFGIFINGNVTMGDKDRSFNEPGFDFDARDITIGGDYRFTPELIFGAALGYGENETVFENGGGNIDFDAIALSLYGTYYRSQEIYADGIVSLGTNSYDTRRRISFTAVSEDAVGDTDGTEFTLSIGGGYDVTREAWTLGPYGRLTYLKADIDGYQESPTVSGVELSLDDQSITSLTTVIGGKAIYNISADWGVFSPQVNLEWEHEFDNDSRLITGRFVNDPSGTGFGIPTDNPERDVLNLGAGATATFTGGRTGFIFVESLLGHEDLTQLSITGGFRFEF